MLCSLSIVIRDSAPLRTVWGKHIFPNHIPAGGEAKKVDQHEGIPGDGAMGSIGL